MAGEGEKVFESFGKQEGTDREVLRNLLDVVPAGLEDLAAVSVLTDALVQERFKRIVVDPVASSTGVRLLGSSRARPDLADRPPGGAGEVPLQGAR
jgi:hypothetical protein